MSILKISNKMLFLTFLSGILSAIVSCNNQEVYYGFAAKIVKTVNSLSSENDRVSISISCDSMTIEQSFSPTEFQQKYDTVIDELLNECDFALIEYNRGERSIQRISCNSFSHANIHFEETSYRKGDTMTLELVDCELVESKDECHVIIK